MSVSGSSTAAQSSPSQLVPKSGAKRGFIVFYTHHQYLTADLTFDRVFTIEIDVGGRPDSFRSQKNARFPERIGMKSGVRFCCAHS